jgi:hypothetical protein
VAPRAQGDVVDVRQWEGKIKVPEAILDGFINDTKLSLVLEFVSLQKKQVARLQNVAP